MRQSRLFSLSYITGSGSDRASGSERGDREEKVPVYAREGARHAWLIDPIKKTLEVHVLGARRRWRKVIVHREAARVRVAPFEAIEIDLSILWA